MSCSLGCNFCQGPTEDQHTGNCCAGRSCSAPKAEEPDETFSVLDLMRAIVAQEHEKQMRELRRQQMAEEDAERRADQEVRNAELRVQDEDRRQALMQRLEQGKVDEQIRANAGQTKVEYIEATPVEEAALVEVERYKLA